MSRWSLLVSVRWRFDDEEPSVYEVPDYVFYGFTMAIALLVIR